MAWEQDMETLARERGPALVGYAFLLTGEFHAAQDLVQDALVRTFSRRRSGTDVAWLEAYVRRTVLNTYLNTYRKHSRWSAVMHLAADTSHNSADMSPDTIAADRADIHTALARLAPRERACVVLRHFEDMTVREIAVHLDLSEGAVKRYLHDAHQRLHPLLGADDTTDIEIISKGARR